MPLTHDEVDGLKANPLLSKEFPAAHTRLSEWSHANADRIGGDYASEVARHFR